MRIALAALLLLAACSTPPGQGSPAPSGSTASASGSTSPGASGATGGASGSSGLGTSTGSSGSSVGGTSTASSGSTGSGSSASTGSSGSSGSTGACLAAGSPPGTCSPGGTSDCCPGLVCTGENAGFYCGEPLGGACSSDGECEVHKLCDAGTCMSRSQLGAACEPSGSYPDGGGYLLTCGGADDCCAGEGCFPSGGQPFFCQRLPGQPCALDSDCGSHRCAGGTCQ